MEQRDDPAWSGGHTLADAVTIAAKRARQWRSLPDLLERQSVLGVVLVSGAILYMLALVGYPFALALYLSVSDANVATSGLGNFVGFDNFVSLFQSSVFLTALRNTLFFTLIAAVFKSLLGTTLAFLLAENLPGTRVFRLVILLPWTIPIALSSITWKWMFDSQYSIINWIGTHLGIIHGNPIWLGDPNLAAISIIVVNIWRGTAFSMLLFGGALTTVPPSQLEAARLAGASGWQQIRDIVLPSIRGHILTNLLLISLWTFNDFAPFLITAGGPNFATDTLPVYIFRNAFRNLQFGYGAAISTIMLLINLVIGLAYLRVLRARD